MAFDETVNYTQHTLEKLDPPVIIGGTPSEPLTAEFTVPGGKVLSTVVVGGISSNFINNIWSVDGTKVQINALMDAVYFIPGTSSNNFTINIVVKDSAGSTIESGTYTMNGTALGTAPTFTTAPTDLLWKDSDPSGATAFTPVTFSGVNVTYRATVTATANFEGSLITGDFGDAESKWDAGNRVLSIYGLKEEVENFLQRLLWNQPTTPTEMNVDLTVCIIGNSASACLDFNITKHNEIGTIVLQGRFGGRIPINVGDGTVFLTGQRGVTMPKLGSKGTVALAGQRGVIFPIKANDGTIVVEAQRGVTMPKQGFGSAITLVGQPVFTRVSVAVGRVDAAPNDTGLLVATDPDGTWVDKTISNTGSGTEVAIDRNAADIWVMATNKARIFTVAHPGGTWIQRFNGQLGSISTLNGLATDGTIWCAVGDESDAPHNLPRLATATDPTGTWTENTTGVPNPSTDHGYHKVEYANDIWVAVADAGSEFVTATDPTGTWTSRSAQSVVQPRDIAFGNGVWVMVGQTGKLDTATDPTGTWTARTSGFGTNTMEAVKYFPKDNIWIAVGTGGSLTTSTNPTGTWTARTSSFGSTDINSIDFDGIQYIAVGRDGKIATATNPTGTWTQQTTPFGASDILLFIKSNF